MSLAPDFGELQNSMLQLGPFLSVQLLLSLSDHQYTYED